jgi:hypothetical protein
MAGKNGKGPTIDIELSKGKKIEVRKATVLMSSAMGRVSHRNIEALPALIQAFEDVDEKDIYIQAVMIYPALYACSFPKDNLPTLEEFLVMSDVIAAIWVEAVEKLNPHWFQYGEKEPQTDAEKSKKGEKP